MLHHQEIIHISSMPILAHLPNVEEYLTYCRSIKTRRKTRFLINPSEISRLREWHETPNAFPILVAHCRGLYNMSRDFSVELLDTIRAGGIPAIWGPILHGFDTNGRLSLKDVLLSLSLQTLALNQKACHNGFDPITSSQFQDALTEDRCFEVLRRCMFGLSKLYIILDMAVVNDATSDEDTSPSEFIQKFLDQLLVRPEFTVRLVIVADEFDECFDIEQDPWNESQILVFGQNPGPLRRKRANRGFTRYSSHVFPPRSSTKGIIDWLPTDVDTGQ